MGRKRERERGVKGLPWYSDTRGVWVTPGDPKKTALRDRDGLIKGDTPEAEARATAAWHAAQSGDRMNRAGDDNLVKDVLNAYLNDQTARGVTDQTHRDTLAYFKGFAARWPGLTVRALAPVHVERWWADNPGWGPSVRNLSGSYLKAAVKWASLPAGGRLIPTNPLDGMKLPPIRNRTADVVVTDEEFAGLLALVKSPAVRDVLEVLWETGTRPVNLSRVTAANVERTAGGGLCLVFAGHNTDPSTAVHKTFKGTGRALTVPLPPRAADVVARLVRERPTGLLFLSPRGKPWGKVLLANTVAHYAKRAGLAGRFTAYSCRHSAATAMLTGGVAVTDVAAVLGNSPAVVNKRYSHLTGDPDRLAGVLIRGRRPNPGPAGSGGGTATG